MWTSTAKPTMKPGPSDTAGIKRKEHSCKRTPHISKIKVVEGEGVKDQLLSPWGWQESSSSAGVRQVMSRSSEEPHLVSGKGWVGSGDSSAHVGHLLNVLVLRGLS